MLALFGIRMNNLKFSIIANQKKARAGEIKNFTGIDSPYEIPNKPNLIVDTEKESVSESVDKIFSAISNKIK